MMIPSSTRTENMIRFKNIFVSVDSIRIDYFGFRLAVLTLLTPFSVLINIEEIDSPVASAARTMFCQHQ